jgi:zinc transporter 9
LQKEGFPSGGSNPDMTSDDIAEYAAIERKEKEQLEASFLQQPELSYKAVMRALIGNTFITLLKFGVYLRTGSAAMLSEAVHTLVDSGNQAILLVGIRQMSNTSDKRHPYGYGRAAYFWGLVSALGMFWVGSGVSFIHGVNELLHPPEMLIEPGWETWTTLGISFGVDGYVLYKTIVDMKRSVPKGMSFYDFTKKIRDPFVMAVLLEDMAATTGVLIAVGGIGLT